MERWNIGLRASPKNSLVTKSIARTGRGHGPITAFPLRRGHSTNPTELLDIITEYAPLLEVWNAEMREFLAQERKENTVFVTL